MIRSLVPDHITKMASTTDSPTLTKMISAMEDVEKENSLLKEKVACLEKEVEVSKKRCRDVLDHADRVMTFMKKHKVSEYPCDCKGVGSACNYCLASDDEHDEL